MARIAGVDVPRDKRVVISLTYILGIGNTSAEEIVAKAGVSDQTRDNDLTEEEMNKIREDIDSYKVEGDLRREQNMHVKRLIEIASYRGIRNRRSLPVRRQKTNNNASTRKGLVKTVANKRK